MPRLVRRRPFTERVKAFLNPLDFLLWLSEELETRDWDQLEKEWALPVGVGLNVVMLIVRANSASGSRVDSDIFGDEGPSWLSRFCTFVVCLLGAFALLNASYTFWRKRHYRLFETPIDKAPSTPSARRVQVNSSPTSSSPMLLLSNMLASASAESRSHPLAERDVWEVGVWNPHPLAIRLFSLFSPGHVLIYCLFLPTTTADSRPSATVLKTVLLCVLLTVQLSLLSGGYAQQGRDQRLVHKEVFNEYDTKFVHPRTAPVTRDVATQFSEAASYRPTAEQRYNTVQIFSPVAVRQPFKISPNPNYVRHVDPEGLLGTSGQSARPILSTPRTVATPTPNPRRDWTTPTHLQASGSDWSSPIRPHSAVRQALFQNTGVPANGSGGDGGSLGVYSHANSPLRKTASMSFDYRSAAAAASAAKSTGLDYRGAPLTPGRQPSPLKRASTPGGISPAGGGMSPSVGRKSGRH